MLRALQALLVHERNQQGALHRALQARQMGVEAPEQYAATFPGSTVTTNNTTTTNNAGGGLLKGALLSAALLSGGAGAAAGLLGLQAPPAQDRGAPAPGPTAPPEKPAQADREYDAVTEVRQPDGSWKVIRRDRLKRE